MMLSWEYLRTWFLARYGASDRGASLVEYVLLVSLIALTCLGALTYFGGNNGNSLNRSGHSIVTAG